MRKIYCSKRKNYKEFIKPKNIKISYICDKSFLSIICNKCGSKNEKIFKEEESIEISKILGLIANIEEYQRIYNQPCRYFLQNLD